MGWWILQLPFYAWKHRKDKNTRENYAAFVRKCAEEPAVAERIESGRQAGAYPEGPDGGWRYRFQRLPRHDYLRETYGLEAIAGQGSTFERALSVMDWLTAHSWYCGMSFAPLPDNSKAILRYIYDKPFKRAINCRHKTIAFADCLLAVGIAALPVCIINEGYCHMVVHVWLPEERRWVLLDPSFDSYITDEAGRALHLFEIHDCRRRGEALRVAQYSFNGTQDFRQEYLEAFVLCCLLEITVYNGTGSKRSDPRNCLMPEGMPRKKKKLRAISVAELLAVPKMM